MRKLSHHKNFHVYSILKYTLHCNSVFDGFVIHLHIAEQLIKG